jgi:hypothetical protein
VEAYCSARLLARSALFTLSDVASLAIGLGGNIAIFTIAKGLLLAPPTASATCDRVARRRHRGSAQGRVGHVRRSWRSQGQS